jgi:DNA-binding XRE family transcriptional regulator
LVGQLFLAVLLFFCFYTKEKIDGDYMKLKRDVVFRYVGAKIQYYRNLADMTQEDLAKVSNISQSALGRIERGKYNNNISLSVLMDIANGLEMDFTLLLTFSEDEKKQWKDER